MYRVVVRSSRGGLTYLGPYIRRVNAVAQRNRIAKWASTETAHVEEGTVTWKPC